jgi:heme-degrading monooxygenase HmoA
MYAVVVYHETQPGLLKGDTAALDRATETWIAYLARQPGFVEFISLGNAGADRVVAVSLWESAEHFQRVLADPASETARAAFGDAFVSLTPEFLDVRAHRRA